MHLRLLLSILNQSVMILVLNLREPSTFKYFLDLVCCEIVGSGLVTANVEIIFQFLVRSLSQAKLRQIIPAIVSKVKDGSICHLIKKFHSHLCKIFR